MFTVQEKKIADYNDTRWSHVNIYVSACMYKGPY